MRPWQIMTAAAMAASAAAVAVFLHDGVPAPHAVWSLLSHWPTISVGWLAVYGLVALCLATIVEIGPSRRVPAAAHGGFLPRRFAVHLVAVQYVTAVLVLLGIGLASLIVDIDAMPALPASIGRSLPLVAAAALAVCGLASAVAISITDRIRRPALTKLAEDRSELLLREILDILQEERGARRALAEAAERVEQGQRSVLAVVKEVATAVNRLRQSLDEIKRVSQARISADAQADTSPDFTETADELRAAAAVVEAAVGKLGEVAVLLSTSGGTSVGEDTRGSSPSRSRVSSELHDLLRQLPTADRLTNRTDDGRD